jgi:predicted AAA+ superfamily ATPase
MINRPFYVSGLTTAINRSPITALLGPRQCGKTTLAHLLMKEQQAVYFDLESVPDKRRLENPELVLGDLDGLVILDEIQLIPSLFQALRVLVDRPDNKTRYLILGSASPEIINNTSETLAGRIEFIELSGFDLGEVGKKNWETLWLRGGFPRSYLADSEEDSLAWREGFIRTFLERDIPQLGINISPVAMRRFWTMLAHYHGQTWNASQIGRSMGLTHKTMRSYLDVLTGTYMVRQLQPWIANLGKRQVKSPKVYFRDSGLLHSLLEIADNHNLLGHPKVGASWEGFAIEQVLQYVRPNQAYFWATHNGAEIDLLFSDRGKTYGVEVKFNEAPKVTASMRSALTELNLEHLWVIYPGKEAYSAHEQISVWPLDQIDRLPFGAK